MAPRRLRGIRSAAYGTNQDHCDPSRALLHPIALNLTWISVAMRPLAILPSLLACDFTKLGEEVRSVCQASGDLLHIDVMDGHFVPNITFGPALIHAIRPLTPKLFDMHLMISPCDPYLAAFAQAGADTLIVHAEAGPHLYRTLQAIRNLGKRAGVALNPATHENAIVHVLDTVDVVLVMTV